MRLDGELGSPLFEDVKRPDGTVTSEKGSRPIVLYLPRITNYGNFSGGSPRAETVSAEATRLYLIVDDQVFEELDDDKTVEYHEIKDGHKLYLLT